MICNVQFATQVLYRCPFRSVTYQQQLGRYLLKHSVKYLNHVSNTFYLAEVRCMNKKTFSFRSDRLLKRSEEHTSELQSLMRTSYAVFCLKKKKQLQQMINMTQ